MSSQQNRQEEILVLYGSQTGNSEQAAETLSTLIPTKLSTSSVTVTSKHMQLDDFLEQRDAEWTSIIVIITSSYGVGQAPLGCYKFRSLCNHINSQQGSDSILQGIAFAMLGLGDSKFTTFFENPTQIHKALRMAGASHIGPLGKADASGDQLKVIDEWIQGIIPVLADAVKNVKSDEEQREKLKAAKKKTLSICYEIFDEFKFISKNDERSTVDMLMKSAILVAILAILFMLFGT